MNYEMYKYAFYISLILCGIMFIVSLVIFFAFKIPKAVGMVTGITERRYLKSVRSKNKNNPDIENKIKNTDKKIGNKISDEYYKHDSSDYLTEEMTGDVSESSYDDSTATLTDLDFDEGTLEEHITFKILYEIIYIHTNERI